MQHSTILRWSLCIATKDEVDLRSMDETGSYDFSRTVRHAPAVDFILWVRMNQANEEVAQIYLLPVQNFPDHQYLWPSTRTLPSYQQFAHASMADVFGLS